LSWEGQLHGKQVNSVTERSPGNRILATYYAKFTPLSSITISD